MLKVHPINKKVLVEKLFEVGKDSIANLGEIIIPKTKTVTRRGAVLEGKYIFKVISSNNPDIKPGVFLLSDTSNIEEYKFTLEENEYSLTFIDELDIICVLTES